MLAANPDLAKLDNAVDEIVGMKDKLRGAGNQEEFDILCTHVQTKYELSDGQMAGVLAVAGTQIGIYTSAQATMILVLLKANGAIN
jgi:hypothetical protein